MNKKSKSSFHGNSKKLCKRPQQGATLRIAENTNEQEGWSNHNFLLVYRTAQSARNNTAAVLRSCCRIGRLAKREKNILKIISSWTDFFLTLLILPMNDFAPSWRATPAESAPTGKSSGKAMKGADVFPCALPGKALAPVAAFFA